MKPPAKFALRFALFCLPLALLFGLCERVLQRSGELIPVERIVERQRHEPDLIWRRGFVEEQIQRYKFLGIMARRPQILTLGSSRILEYHAPMFGVESGAFFNGGLLTREMKNLLEFQELAPDYAPKTLLLSIDPWWLNGGVQENLSLKEDVARDRTQSWQSRFVAYQTLILKRDSFWRLLTMPIPPNKIGLGPLARNTGFQPTGARFVPRNAYKPHNDWHFEDRLRPPLLERIHNGSVNFKLASALSEERIAMLRQALSEWKRRGTTVLGVLPPISQESVAALETHPILSGFWKEYLRRIPQIFEEQGFYCLDASATAKLGIDDRWLWDAIHPMEACNLFILRALLQEKRAQRALPHAQAAIEALIHAPKTDFWHVDYSPLNNRTPLKPR